MIMERQHLRHNLTQDAPTACQGLGWRQLAERLRAVGEIPPELEVVSVTANDTGLILYTKSLARGT